MAIFPCDQHGAYYRGPQRTAYPALVNGISTQRKKRRLCPQCFDELALFCAARLRDLNEPGVYDMRDGCSNCGELVTDTAIFVTLYPLGEPRHDFYGRACDSCADGQVGMALFGEQERLIGA